MRAVRTALVLSALVAAKPAFAQEPQPAAPRPSTPVPSSPTPAAQAAPGRPAATAPAPRAQPERWENISVQTANSGTYRLPVGRGMAGPSVLHVQVLLNRAFFSPGMLDGHWGRNTQNAVTWLQTREGLPATGTVDSLTYARLAQLAGAGPTVREHVLTEAEVAGPFVPIPEDIYAHARLRCSCYESLGEKLTETFQTTRQVLRRLNPGVTLDSVAAGTVLHVPQVRDTAAAPEGEVRQIVVSGSGNHVQALDSAGRILYHFAATLGSTIDPSPDGDFRVTSIHPNPWWHYQPRLLAHVPDDRPNAMIPPGPNNAVGVVWMSLSAPHYGIHGTKSPETIGYAQSAGCVRLTNWDVVFLSGRVPPGTPVRFSDTGGRNPLAPPAPEAEQPGVLGVPADSVRRDSAAVRPATPAPTRPAATDSTTARPTMQPAAAPARPATTPAATQPTMAPARPAAADRVKARPRA